MEVDQSYLLFKGVNSLPCILEDVNGNSLYQKFLHLMVLKQPRNTFLCIFDLFFSAHGCPFGLQLGCECARLLAECTFREICFSSVQSLQYQLGLTIIHSLDFLPNKHVPLLDTSTMLHHLWTLENLLQIILLTMASKLLMELMCLIEKDLK